MKRVGAVWVNAPHFCAGMTVRARVSATPCAPILRWTLGKTWRFLEAYFQKRGWQYEIWEAFE